MASAFRVVFELHEYYNDGRYIRDIIYNPHTQTHIVFVIHHNVMYRGTYRE